MRAGKRMILVALGLLFAVVSAGAETIQLKKLAPIEGDVSLYPYFRKDTHTFICNLQGKQKGLYEIDLERLKLQEIKLGDTTIIGIAGNKLYLESVRREYLKTFYDRLRYDPVAGTFEEVDDQSLSRSMVDFQNGITFTQEAIDSTVYDPYEFNTVTKSLTKLPFTGRILFLTPDRTHAVAHDPPGDRLTVWNTVEKRVSSTVKPFHQYDLYRIEPLNNVFFLASETNPGTGDYRIYSIDGKLIDTLRFSMEGVAPDQLRFNGDLTRAVLYTRKGYQNRSNYFVDTTAFRDYLDKKGLLFHVTTATATESQVRVRENPNLEAQVYGALTKGDALEVLDRSGIKVKIGDMEDWWYKIKRKSDGLSGWAYGAFLKLESYQGELGVKK